MKWILFWGHTKTRMWTIFRTYLILCGQFWFKYGFSNIALFFWNVCNTKMLRKRAMSCWWQWWSRISHVGHSSYVITIFNKNFDVRNPKKIFFFLKILQIIVINQRKSYKKTWHSFKIPSFLICFFKKIVPICFWPRDITKHNTYLLKLL